MSQSKKDYYEVLSVDKNADLKTIKTAFRKLARQYHPDMNPDDPTAEDKFKEVAEAFEVLSDEEKRSTYDRFGHAGLNGNIGSQFTGFSFEDLFSNLGGFGDIFGGLFGSSRSSSRSRRGQDVRINLNLTFEESINGTKKKVKIPNYATCPTCHGSRAKQGKSVKTCSTCKGSGEYRQISRSAFGSIVNVTTCPSCKGQGTFLNSGDECEMCEGLGKVKQYRTTSVDVPKGIEDGMMLRVRGEGRPGELEGPSGDLLVRMIVEAHPFIQREGSILHMELPISFTQALLGIKLKIPTINGKDISVDIPAGTESGDLIRLRNKGSYDPQYGSKGDFIVKVKVKYPKKLSKSTKKIIEQLNDSIDNSYVFKGYKPLEEALMKHQK